MTMRSLYLCDPAYTFADAVLKDRFQPLARVVDTFYIILSQYMMQHMGLENCTREYFSGE